MRRFGDAYTEGDVKALTEAGWHIERHLAASTSSTRTAWVPGGHLLPSHQVKFGEHAPGFEPYRKVTRERGRHSNVQPNS